MLNSEKFLDDLLSLTDLMDLSLGIERVEEDE